MSSAYQRKEYYTANFNVVEPVEYSLYATENKTLQYVPILKSLQVLLSRKDIVDKIYNGTQSETETANKIVYKSFRDGLYFKPNSFFSVQESRLSIGLYVDDFEVCKPLGTFRKTPKLCSVLGAVLGLIPLCPPFTYFAILCKTENI